MVKNNESCISISTWNINGLEYKSHGVKSNKLNDNEIIETLKRSDCIGLLETHADSNTDIYLKPIKTQLSAYNLSNDSWIFSQCYYIKS